MAASRSGAGNKKSRLKGDFWVLPRYLRGERFAYFGARRLNKRLGFRLAAALLRALALGFNYATGSIIRRAVRPLYTCVYEQSHFFHSYRQQ
jgi:hypothetical protein